MTTDSHRTVRFDVKESLLRWALERSGKSPEELSSKQNLRNLNEWLAGTKKPTRPQLEAFAKATYTPFGYLVLSEPPREQPSSMPHFRTVETSKPVKRSIDLRETIRVIEQRQLWVRDYLLEIGADPLEFVGSSSIDDNPIMVSNKIRTRLGLARDWASDHPNWKSTLNHLEEKIEELRIFLTVSSIVQHNTRRRLNPEEFRGFVLVDDYAPFVFVNSADVGGAQMFTLAHELAHVWIGESASFDLQHLASNPDIKLEFACNRIAAEFLVPTDDLLSHWNMFVESKDPYKEISNYFKVSRIVAIRRALDAQLISREEFNEIYNNYIQQAQNKRQESKEQQYSKSYPSFYVTAIPRIGKRFIRTVNTAVGERRMLYRDAYDITGLSSESFDKIVSKVDIRQ